MKFIFRNINAGFVEYRFDKPGTRNKTISSHYLPLPLSETELYSALPNGETEGRFLFGAAPRRRKSEKRGTDADVAEIGCLWAVVSYDRTPGGVIGVLEKLSRLPLRPSLVARTMIGRGIFYVFNSPLRNTQLLEWKEMNDRLNAFLGVKIAPRQSDFIELEAFDPGNENSSTEPLVYDAESSGVYYSTDEVKDFVRSLEGLFPPEDFALIPAAKFYNPTESDLRARKVPLRVIESIFKQKTSYGSISGFSEEQGAEDRDFLIVKTLLEKNFSKPEIVSIYKNNKSGCGISLVGRRSAGNYLRQIIERAEAAAKAKTGGSPSEGELPPGYIFDSAGAVWLETKPARGKSDEPKLTMVSKSPLRIAGIRENIDTGQISVVVSYEYLGKTRSNVISRSQMCNARSLVSVLSGEGAPVNSNNARLLVSYLEAYEHEFADVIPRKKVTSKFGRSRESRKFLLPGLMKDVEFEPGGAGDTALYRAFSARKGTLAAWVEVMNSVAHGGFMIPQIAVVAAFVPPLQTPLQIPNFILDIFGNTSSGKSTTLKLAASVFGSPFDPDSLIQQWMNTKIAVEQIAGTCSELPIFLDDAQHCSNELKRTVVYMIANGKGKGRAGGRGGLKETMTWRTVALSTSEEPLHESSAHEGVRGRLLPLGGFVAPFPPNSGTLVQTLERAVGANHGFAGEVFVRHLNGWSGSDWSQWERRYRFLRDELTRSSSSDVVGRVGGYIAAIGVAAEIACPLLGLDFKPDVLVAWLVGHLQEQQSNQNMVLFALRVLADHYLSNRNAFAGTPDYRFSRVKGLLGVSKNGEYVGFTRAALDAVFSKYRWNQTAILQKMAEAKVLIATETDRFTKKVTFAGVKHRLVCVKWSALLPDDVPEI